MGEVQKLGCGEHVAYSVGLPARDAGTSCSPAAQAALVKSRDMHWSLLAQRGQRDVSLSSLRLLIVADGANPCEYCPPPTPEPLCSVALTTLGS